MPTATKPPSILVNCYAGTRLYDATNGRYVVLDQLHQWAAEGVVFAVIDAATGADVTRVLIVYQVLA